MKRQILKLGLIILTLGVSKQLLAQDVVLKKIEVTNKLDFKREEVVSVSARDLKSILKNKPYKNFHVKSENDEILRTQWIDNNLDGNPDELLFQATVSANAKSRYALVYNPQIKEPENDIIAYSRQAPERDDDYTWENDKTAYRVYGPLGQKRNLEGVSGSTLSSGVDVWLKKTPHSVINKWYAGHVNTPGYYHKDRGEGYDPYHVGVSRGAGGTGVWKNDSLMVSENYISYKTIAAGPLRTVFELVYKPYGPFQTSEVKRVTLDLGSNFSKFEVSLNSLQSLKDYAVGLTMHKGAGDYKINENNGWMRYWEKIDDAYVGTSVLMDTSKIVKAFANISKVPDQSNLIMLTNAKKEAIFYVGSAWTKSNQISTVGDWDGMLDLEVQKIKSPLLIKLHK